MSQTPTVRVFRHLDELDAFVVTATYRDIADTLDSRRELLEHVPGYPAEDVIPELEERIERLRIKYFSGSSHAES